jgi:hypothetical protein
VVEGVGEVVDGVDVALVVTGDGGVASPVQLAASTTTSAASRTLSVCRTSLVICAPHAPAALRRREKPGCSH